MVYGRIFEGMMLAFLLMGTAIGLVIAGLIWFLVWLFGHIDFNWV